MKTYGEWIPATKDRPYPEVVGRYYLVTAINRDYADPAILVAWCDIHGKWNSADLLQNDSVTAWMELPEPYEEGEQ